MTEARRSGKIGRIPSGKEFSCRGSQVSCLKKSRENAQTGGMTGGFVLAAISHSSGTSLGNADHPRRLFLRQITEGCAVIIARSPTTGQSVIQIAYVRVSL
jgi:hypothetical protein